MLLREQECGILGVIQNKRVSGWLSFRLAVSENVLIQETQFNICFFYVSLRFTFATDLLPP